LSWHLAGSHLVSGRPLAPPLPCPSHDSTANTAHTLLLARVEELEAAAEQAEATFAAERAELARAAEAQRARHERAMEEVSPPAAQRPACPCWQGGRRLRKGTAVDAPGHTVRPPLCRLRTQRACHTPWATAWQLNFACAAPSLTHPPLQARAELAAAQESLRAARVAIAERDFLLVQHRAAEEALAGQGAGGWLGWK
jgi:hypothetical protein